MNNKELTIVTAFFDIGRKDISESSRSNDDYLNYFKFWARMKNKIIVYTSKEMAVKVKKIRKEFNLLDKTIVIVVDDIYSIEPELYKRMEVVANDETFLNFRYMNNSMDNNPKYDYIMFLKAYFIKDAVSKGYASDMIAWLDFGFNHGGVLYTNEEEFDFLWKTDLPDDKITLFARGPENNKPIFQIVQSYDIYLMGAPVIVPAKLSNNFWEDVKNAMRSLLDVGFIDDDQTLFIMASRNKKSNYNIVKSDWFMPIKEHGGEHLTIKETKPVNTSLKNKIMTKLRIIKRNRRCIQRLKKIFMKDSLD